ncbi:MAG: hypothetical protein PVJ72_17510 [Gammaproteobacteria bacterium]|jgi:hypothetical protein
MDIKAIEALKQHIDQAAARLQIRQDEDAIGSLIYMGNHQDAVPRELIIDPILESGEIHTWMLMKVNVNNPLSATRIPSQETLMQQLKTSRPIVSRHLQVLRALRWITLCAEVPFKGVVYAQHDSPLSLQDTMTLDTNYLNFLEQTPKSDVFKRARVIKRAVLERIGHQIVEQGLDLNSHPSLLQRYSQRLAGHHSDDPNNTHLACRPDALPVENMYDLYGRETSDCSSGEPDQRNDRVNVFNPEDNGRVKDFNTEETEEIDRVKIFNTEGNHRVKNFNTTTSENLVKNQSNSRVKNINTVTNPCSSSYLKTTTTTKGSNLIFPGAISKSPTQMQLATGLLERLPVDLRQFALYWIADRIQAGEKGTDKIVGNPIGLLGWLISQLLNGTLPPSSYGLRDQYQPSETTKVKKIIQTQSEDKNQVQARWREQMSQLGFHVGSDGRLVKSE